MRKAVARGDGLSAWLALGAVVSLVAGGLLVPGGVAGYVGSISSGTARAAHPIQHVVVVVLENEQLKQVIGHGPYERYLAGTYGNVSGLIASCHPSAPNYLAMISAETNQCGTDAYNSYNNTTILDRLSGAGFSWASYAENLPSGTCASPGGTTTAMFVPHHVPALFFSNVTANRTFCRQHVLGSGAFNKTVANGTLPTFSFFTPNMCDNGHNGCGTNHTSAQQVAQADAWLNGFLSPILNHSGKFSSKGEQTLVNHTAFLILWDEGTGSNAGYTITGITSGENYAWCQANGAKGDAVCGGHIFAVVVSPYSLGRSFTSRDSDSGIAATVEWLFHLAPLGNPGSFDTSRGFPAMKSIFSFRSDGY
ncbi:MAG: alkaline phosphatase family protein [Candidatus Lutacidiplasmatales archaeon]